MITRQMVLFDEAGPQNTQDTLEAARRRAQELGIRSVIVATSTGQTALKAAEVFAGTGVSLFAVTLHAGRWKVYCPPDSDTVQKAAAKGVKFLTATHVLKGNVEAAIRDKFGGLPPVEVIAHTYYTFCQGMKVAVEVTLMAADAGLISVEDDVIAVAGTGKGADTAIVLKPAFSTDFFSLKVREIIAMPR
jgi:hypothetical protein